MTTNSNIHTTVMRRVRTIHALRTMATGVGVSLVLLVAALYVIGREVWVARVFENMPSLEHVPQVVHFFTSAFLTTNIVVQLLLLVCIGSAVWFVRELSRIIVHPTLRFA